MRIIVKREVTEIYHLSEKATDKVKQEVSNNPGQQSSDILMNMYHKDNFYPREEACGWYEVGDTILNMTIVPQA